MDCRQRSCISHKELKKYYKQEPDGTCPSSCAECSRFYPDRFRPWSIDDPEPKPKPDPALLKALDNIDKLGKKQSIQKPTSISESENLKAFWNGLDERGKL